MFPLTTCSEISASSLSIVPNVGGSKPTLVENLPAMHDTWVQSLGQEDPLEKGMATHSSILAWRISWTVEPGRL